MALAFTDKSCFVSALEKMLSLELDVGVVPCEVADVPNIVVDPEVQAIRIPTTAPSISVNRILRIAGGGSSGSTTCIPEQGVDGLVVGSTGGTYVSRVFIDGNQLKAELMQDQYDTCGQFISSIPAGTENIADLGPCP